MSQPKAISIALHANVPILLWGSPGSGKTSFFQAFALNLKAHMETLIASIREPTDFGGLPIITDNGVELAPANWAKRAHAAAMEKMLTIIFIDEISTAAPAVQAALLRVIQEKVVGDLELPRDVRMVAAANPPEQAAGGWELAPPLANRFAHFDWAPSTADWIEGMLNGFEMPQLPTVPDFDHLIPVKRALIASFIKKRPELLEQIPKEDSKAGRAWPSRRTWDMASRLAAAAEAANAGEDIELMLITAAVGGGAASEYVTYMRNLDLPDPESILADPDGFTLPIEGDKRFAILSSMVSCAIGNLTPERYMAAWRVLAKAAEMGATDVAAVSARALAKKGEPKLGDPKEYVRAFVPMLKAAGLI